MAADRQDARSAANDSREVESANDRYAIEHPHGDWHVASAAKRRPISEWYGSSRYDWFMLGIVLGAAWASLVWWLFA